jgi:hypothetical protein
VSSANTRPDGDVQRYVSPTGPSGRTPSAGQAHGLRFSKRTRTGTGDGAGSMDSGAATATMRAARHVAERGVVGVPSRVSSAGARARRSISARHGWRGARFTS